MHGLQWPMSHSARAEKWGRGSGRMGGGGLFGGAARSRALLFGCDDSDEEEDSGGGGGRRQVRGELLSKDYVCR